MFAGRIHSTVIELKEGDDILFKLPPASEGPIQIKVFHADVTLPPVPGAPVAPAEPAPGPTLFHAATLSAGAFSSISTATFHSTAGTPTPAGGPVVRDHRAGGGSTAESRPVVRDHRDPTGGDGPVIRDHRHPPGDTPPLGGIDPFIDALPKDNGGGPPDPNVDSSPARNLEIELRHSNHLVIPGKNHILSNSLWFDDLWRLHVKRIHPLNDLTPNPSRYRFEFMYMSQLPLVKRRIPAGFFHQGFELNWNNQQYVQAVVEGSKIFILFDNDLKALQDIQDITIETGVPLVEAKNIHTTGTHLDVGAGPSPFDGQMSLFFSIRIDFAADGKIVVPLASDIDLPAFFFKVKLFLWDLGELLFYLPSVESNLLDALADVDIPDPQLTNPFHTVNAKATAKKAIEDALYKAQFSPGAAGSTFGAFLSPWLAGDRRELSSMRYEPGPNDVFDATGTTEPATGTLVVNVVGRKQPKVRDPLLIDGGFGSGTAPEDGSIPLFDLPDEVPDPVIGGDGEGSVLGPFGGVQPGPIHPVNIGALSKIDHIVVLMQENRSFDQVLGYLKRDKINPEVDGLLPPDDPNHEQQFNRFNNRNFFPQKADANDPKRSAATAWPSFTVPGPCHDTDCVLSQIDDNMGRFVANFAGRVGETSPFLRLIMDYFDADQLPVYAVLAREFGICDRWYTAHAGPTWPNRFVLFTGDLNLTPLGDVETDNPDLKTLTPLQPITLFDILDDRGVPWKLYEHGYSFLRLYGKHTFDIDNVIPFDDPVRGFEPTARAGLLPPVTLIEPDYIDLPPGNDDHPPADMAGGQILVNRIFRALVESPAWERTLFIITYDEHGGFYDHKQPPTDAAPLRGQRRTLGPRVPAFVISPLVPRGAVFHSSFDHTSIGATILRRFCGRRVPKVSPRMDAARDLREVLTLDTPRPRSDFQNLGLPPLQAAAPVNRRSLRARQQKIGQPEGKDDFHFIMAAMRLVTGEAPEGIQPRAKPAQGNSGELRFYRDRNQDGTGDVANPTVIGLGGWQTMRHLFSGGNGILYAVNQAGQLLFYRDRTQDGTGDVANPQVIGLGGWQNMKFLFSGGNGSIYAVNQAGQLLFYRDQNRNGGGDVSNPAVIGLGGWQNMKFLFSGGNGSIYAVDPDGRLLFYRDRNQNGTGDVSSPAVIGLGGWQAMRHLFSGGNGIIYAVDADGRLLFYRDPKQDGTGDIANPKVIGLGGWQGFRFLFSGGNGNIYAVVG